MALTKEEYLQRIINEVDWESRKIGLKISIEKTKTVANGRQKKR